jgi:hypothetical protein
MGLEACRIEDWGMGPGVVDTMAGKIYNQEYKKIAEKKRVNY